MMHKLIEKQAEAMERWIRDLKEYNEVCYKLDTVMEEVGKLEGITKCYFFPFSYAVEVSVFTKHTKHIKSVLRVFCKHLGKITSRVVKPEELEFKFGFTNDIRLDIWLHGNSCKRVKVGLRKVEVDIYELHCENGE